MSNPPWACLLLKENWRNHSKLDEYIILIATCTMIYSFFMMSTRQNISNFRPLLNATQINAVICQINYVSKNTSAHSFDYVQYSLFSAIGLLPPSTPLSTHSYDYYKKDGMGKSGKIEAKKRVYSTD